MPRKNEASILTELITSFGVSGSESGIRKFIQKEIKPHVHEIKVDKMGNLIARSRGKGPKVMLAAHMDEIGLMVKRIDSHGFIFCTAVGGLDPAAFMGNSIHIKTKKGIIHGFISTREMSAGKYIEKIPEIEDVFVDTGLSRSELKKLEVEIGTYIHLDTRAHYSAKKDIVMGKALDNRIGCYILIELAKKLRNSRSDVYFVFTVQEEMGLYGAKTSAFEIDPEWGIAVDTTHANDAFAEPSRSIGKGPCITVKDGEFISHPCVVGWLKDIAKKKKIPYQLEAAEEGTTDAATIQTTRGGIPTAVLSVPVRNIHTTAGIVSMQDISNAIKLLLELMKRPPHKCIA